MSKKRFFDWDVWDFDCDGSAYIISKDLCPSKDDVPQFIVDADKIHPDCKSEMEVLEGWCKYMVRSDWENIDGPYGGYYVEERHTRPSGKKWKAPAWVVPRVDC